MDFEIKLRFMNCLLCDVNFCPVALVAHSEDEKLLDVFCKYFDLSPKEMESFYDEQVGFPFCDNCRVETLLNLSGLHDKFTSIQKDISQLVTSVSLEIVNIMNRNNENDEDDDQNTQLLSGIRKNISARYKPNVVLMDFCTLFNQRKKPSTLNNKNNNLLCQKYLEREQNDCDFDIKHEAWTPMFNPEESNDEREAERSPPPRKRRKQEFHTISNVENPLNHNKEIPKIINDRDFTTKRKVKNNNQSSNKIPKTSPPSKTVQEKEDKGESKASITYYLSEDEQEESEPEENEPISEYESDENETETENDDSFTDSDDSTPSIPKKPKPKKRIGPPANPRKSVYCAKYDKKIFDPLEEVEPGLFKRKRSGWSFRKETNEEGGEIYKCLAQGCDKMHPVYARMVQHISMTHGHDWVKCCKCNKRYQNQKLYDAHNCKPLVRVNKNINQGGGNWIYVADDGKIFPYREVDKLSNGGFSMECGTCGKLERDRFKMSNHILKKHVGPNRFVCDACGFSCPNNSQLKNHQLRHQSEKHFICELCGLKCKSPSTLRSHILRHEKGKKSFKCDFPNCARAFSAPFALNRHRKSAGHPKPINPEPPLPVEITCPKCLHVYVSQQTFERHSRDCKGKQRVPCLLCEKTFINKSALRNHMKAIHPDDFDNLKSQLYSHQSKMGIGQIPKQVQGNVAEQINQLI